MVLLRIVPGRLVVNLCGDLSPFGLHGLLNVLRNRALLVVVRPDGTLVLRLEVLAVAVDRPELPEERLVVYD